MAQAEIHLISDGRTPLAVWIGKLAAVHPFVDYIHLREKQLSARELLAAAEQMLKAGVPAAKLIINSRLDVALAAGAGGVQLPWHSLQSEAVRAQVPHLRLGRSVHSPEEAEEAARQGADYCLYGHVFRSGSKPGQPGRGLAMLGKTIQRSPVPVIAIGGIEPGNAAQVIRKGAAGIAVMSGICGAEDPAAAALAYCAGFRPFRRQRR